MLSPFKVLLMLSFLASLSLPFQVEAIPLDGLDDFNLALFIKGERVFNRQFNVQDGLGPAFNLGSCGDCHSGGGRGTGGAHGPVDHFGFVDPSGNFDPLTTLGGSSHQFNSITPPAGVLTCAEPIPPPPISNFQVRRRAQITRGVGLIDAIDPADILALSNPSGSPVSGRAALVLNHSTARLEVGKFGWKAQHPTLRQFNAGALVDEMGITNEIFQSENSPVVDPLCDHIADPEDHPDSFGRNALERINHYERFLSPNGQMSNRNHPGAQHFRRIGCADCHNPTFTTTNDSRLPPAWRNKIIYPYSDFLLHDMGSGGDGIAQGDAQRFEMRTTPLWHLGEKLDLWGGASLWHDGNSTSVVDAILRHDGEASASKAAFQALSTIEQQETLHFLGTLGRRQFDRDKNREITWEDFYDYSQLDFQECYNGSGPYAYDHDCAIFDSNEDGFVNTTDLNDFLSVYVPKSAWGTSEGLTDCDCDGQHDLIQILSGANHNDWKLDSCNLSTGVSGSSFSNTSLEVLGSGETLSLQFSSQKPTGSPIYILASTSPAGIGSSLPSAQCINIPGATLLAIGQTSYPGSTYHLQIPIPPLQLGGQSLTLYLQAFVLSGSLIEKSSIVKIIVSND